MRNAITTSCLILLLIAPVAGCKSSRWFPRGERGQRETGEAADGELRMFSSGIMEEQLFGESAGDEGADPDWRD